MMSGDNARPFAPRHSGDCNDGTAIPIAEILSIGNVAETFGISRWVLWYCEFRGLIRRRNRIGAIRVYSWADCERVAFVIKCRRAGLRFSQIAAVVRAAGHDSARVHEAGQELCMALVQKLEGHRKAIDDALAELTHTHALLGAKLNGDVES
jgi:DNA-binding transcriptional MerR regulator